MYIAYIAGVILLTPRTQSFHFLNQLTWPDVNYLGAQHPSLRIKLCFITRTRFQSLYQFFERRLHLKVSPKKLATKATK